MSYKRRIDVMVSSTTVDLGEHRRRIAEVITRLKMTPRIMDNDSTTGKDGVTYSLDLVDEAEIYIVLLGVRYGYIPDDPRNPAKVSMTQLEYERALEREARGDLIVLPFVMDTDQHPVKADWVETDADKRAKLAAFKQKAQLKQVAFFTSIDDLEKKVLQSLTSDSVKAYLAKLTASDKPFVPREGEILEGRYRFARLLGRGGNGEVWKAEERLPDGKSERTLAIKLLKPEVSANEKRVDRFKSEISLACRLKHPHILSTFHWGEVGGQFYACMDYIDGETLGKFMAGRVFTVEETVRLLDPIANALDFAHARRVIHRDLKPDNILVQGDDLFLGDFGLAISPDADSARTETGELVGTKKYMAPEQWDNQPVSAQTDLYALALITYEMLTGSYPFETSSPARLMEQHLHAALPAHPLLPDEILRILQRAAAKHPGERCASAAEFISELRSWRLDPANLETKIRKYLDGLRARLRGDVYEALFVNLEGDVRAVAPPAESQPTAEVYADPYLDRVLDLFTLAQQADRHPAPDEAAQAEPVPNILARLLTSERVVLVGEPGSGKSFTLRRLTLAYIDRFADGGDVPVFVPLNAYKGAQADADGVPRRLSFVEYVQRQLSAELRPYFHELLRAGRLVLICDALNEMIRTAEVRDERDHSATVALLDEVRGLLRETPRFVVSCRIRNYQKELNDLKLARLEVRPLELPAIHDFILKYLRQDGPAFWERIGGSDPLLSAWRQIRDKGELAEFWDGESWFRGLSFDEGTAVNRMWRGARLIPLARSPYLAQMICTLHKRAELPDNRARLYALFVDDLLEREEQQARGRGAALPDRVAILAYLTALAAHMQNAGVTVVPETAVDTAPDIRQAALDASILMLDGADLRFSHQLLQEYFSARTLAEALYADADPRPHFGANWWSGLVWRETLVMLVEFTGEAERALTWAASATPELALAVWRELSGDENYPAELCAAALVGARSRTDETDPRGRAAAYRVLALLDADDRPGISVIIHDDRELPDIVWADPIPPGTYPVGHAGKSFLPPRQHEQTYSYRIAKYPITYRQYQVFIDADDGWKNPKWWKGFGADANYEVQPEEQYFNYWNHPRENISWYDALAFCRWLSSRFGGGYELANIETWAVRLPTEIEWEIAARGTDGRVYPYPGEYDPAKGNLSETGIGRMSAVGIFPDGIAPFGALDMSGNVWEWCLTDYDNPAPDAAQENLRSSSKRVLRGASRLLNKFYTPAAYRFYSSPFNRGDDFGFRLMCGVSPI